MSWLTFFYVNSSSNSGRMGTKDTSERSCNNLIKYVRGRRSCPYYYERPSAISWGASRIYADLKEFHRETFPNIDVSPSEHSIYEWNIDFPAPNGKAVTATLKFDLEYPLVPPRMFIKQRIFHPNVSVNGEVCIQDLRNIWTPAHTVWSFILSIQYLLSDPNPHDPINGLAAKMLSDNPQEYRMYSWKYYELLDEKWERDKNYSLTIDRPESLVISQVSCSENIDQVKEFSEFRVEELIEFEEELLFQDMLEKSVIDSKVIQ